MYAVTLALELFLMTCIGVFTAKIKLVDGSFSKSLTSFVMNICLPCLVFNSMIAEEFSSELLLNCGIVLIVAVAVCGLSFAVGHLLYCLGGKSGSGRITRYGLTFTHFSFMGIPVMEALFGSTGSLYYMVFLIPVRILYYGASKQMLIPPGTALEKPTTRQRISNLLSPCLIALVIGLVFWVLGWKLPTILDYCVSSLAKLCSPLGLILCGITLGKYDFGKLLNIRYLKLPILRTLLMPAIFFGLTRLALLAGMDKTICDMIVIYSCLPIASLTAAFTIQYDPDPEVQFEAAGSTVFATVFSVATIPLWCWLLH